MLKINNKKINEYFQVNINAKLIFKQIKKLFFVNKHVIKILRKNLEIIAINAIYKINKYNISLIIIINHTTLNINFYIVFVFFKKKRTIYKC